MREIRSPLDGILSPFAAKPPVPFVPSSLFASGEDGAWYDPSDVTSLYQSLTGGDYADADGDVVGIMLDKSQMGSSTAAAFIAAQLDLVTNGTFDTDFTGWTTSGTPTVVSDRAELDRNGTIDIVRQTFTTVAGYGYILTGNVTGTLGKIGIGTTSLNDDLLDASGLNGDFQRFFVATGTTTHIYLITASTGTSSWDNITVKEIPGNHAVAPSDAARPLYKTAGGLHWLEFDGVDDSMDTTNNHPFTFTGGVSVFSGFRKIGVTDTYETLFGVGTVGNGVTNGTKSMGFQVTDNGSNRLATDIWQPSGIRGTTVLTSPVSGVATWNIANWSTHRTSGGVIRLDGADESAVAYGPTDPTSLNTSVMKVGVFDAVLAGTYFSGRMYGLLARNTVSSSDEIAEMEAYLAAKSGVTL